MKAVFLQLLASGCVIAAHPDIISNPQFQKLPTLREQSQIQDAWPQERIEKIPQVLQKYGVGAWLVRLSPCQKIQIPSKLTQSQPNR